MKMIKENNIPLRLALIDDKFMLLLVEEAMVWWIEAFDFLRVSYIIINAARGQLKTVNEPQNQTDFSTEGIRTKKL